MKIGFLPIVMFGFAVAVVALSYAFFHHWQPNVEQTANENAFADKLQIEANKLNAAKARVAAAQALVESQAKQWRIIVAAKTPPPTLQQGGINLAVSSYQMTVDARVFRNNIQRAVNRQLRKGGVIVVNGPQVPFPSEDPATVVGTYFNYPALPYPVVVFDLGQVTVTGTYRQITENVRAWKNMPNYLAVASGLSLTGTSPILTGTYNVTIVGFIRGKSIYPGIPPGTPVVPVNNTAPAPGGAPRPNQANPRPVNAK